MRTSQIMVLVLIAGTAWMVGCGGGGKSSGPAGPDNRAPTANAGTDQNVAAGALVTLMGSGTDPDSDPLTFTWSFVSRPSGSTATLANANSATATFTPDLAGTYVLRLTISDSRDGTATGEVRVIAAVTNRVPTASAGANQNVPVGAVVNLMGSGTDPDGDPLTFAWSSTAKPLASSATVVNANAGQASFVPDASGVYDFRLTVTDNRGGSASATVRVLALGPGNVLTIDIIDFAFSPALVTIPVGTTVRWVNSGAAAHNTVSDNNWASPLLQTGESFTRLFDQAGKFNYVCTPHAAAMRGEITVQ